MNKLNRLFILFAGLLLIQIPVYAIEPIAWSNGPSLPEARAQAAALLAPNNTVMLFGGDNPSNAVLVPKLTSGDDVWGIAPDLDTPRIEPGAVRFGNSGILIIGGTGNGEASDEVLTYDYSFGDNQDVAKLAVARLQFAYASDSFGSPYAIGGVNNKGEVLFDVELFDPGSNSWLSVIDLPDARSAASAVGDDNGNVFVFGGVSATGDIVDSVFCYSAIDNEWVTLAPLPVAVKDSVAVFIDTSIYVIGGIADHGTVGAVQVYDLQTGTWTLDTELPEARSSHAAVIDSQGHLLVIGGYNGYGAATASVFLSQRLNAPETLPVITSKPVINASLDQFYNYAVTANGNPSPLFSLPIAPEGMTIDAETGMLNWQPLDYQLGLHDVTLLATNRVGEAEQSFTISVIADTIAPTKPGNLKIIDVGVDYIDLSWTAATDAVGVDHYALYKPNRCGFRGIKTCYSPVEFQQNIVSTQTKVTGLLPLNYYSYVLRAIDAQGNISANSNVVSTQTLSGPQNFQYAFKGVVNQAVISPAKQSIEIQLMANSNPKPTFSIASGPAGMTINSVSGLIKWTPTESDLGTHAVIVKATNSESSQSLTINVTVVADVPKLSVQFNPNSGGMNYAVAGVPFTAQVSDASNTPPTYSLINSPVGMSIDQATGLINWLPAAEQSGLIPVTIRASSAAGSTDFSFNFYSHFTGSVSTIQVTDLTALNPVANWTAPVGAGANLIQGYTVVAIAKYRVGRSTRTDRVEYNVSGNKTQLPLTGLMSGRNYSLSIHAYDASTNRGLVNVNPVSFIPKPALPNTRWTISGINGTSHVVAGQAMQIQLTDVNAAVSPSTFQVISGPAGLSIDSQTGLGQWTPSTADIGTVNIVVRVTNNVGPTDVTIALNVLFSGPVVNASAFRVGSTTAASASWSAPVDNAVAVAQYRVTMHWKWSSRNRSRDMFTTGTNLEFALIPTGAVSHRGVTITPIDALGRLGVPTPLVAYGSIAPPPPSNQPPSVSAGPDQTITLPHNSVALQGSGADDGLPLIPGQLSYQWHVVSGPGKVTFSNAASTNSSASFSSEGQYLLRLVVNDSELSAQDDVIVTVNPVPLIINQIPVVNAGADQVITLPVNNVLLSGSAADDGLPANPGVLSYQWSVVSGPGTVSFSSANNLTSSANFSTEGVYSLRFTASDGLLSNSSNMLVTVNPEPTVVTPPPPSTTNPPPYDENGPELELQGEVEEIGDNYIYVLGYQVWITSETVIKFEDGFGDTLQVGQVIDVKASENNDGTGTATKIQVGG